MAIYQGTDGSIVFAGTSIAQVKSWTLNIEQGTAETTVMGLKWRTKAGTLGNWSGSAEILLDYGSTSHAAWLTNIVAASPTRTTATLTLVSGATGATYFTGTAIITGYSPSAQMETPVAATVSFEGSGSLSEGTA
jgi:hypothetical protein